jgi:hypothetical protein
MKTLLLISICLVMLSCQPDDNVPVIPANDNFDTSTATLVKKGMFVGIGHVASGTASLYDSIGTRVIVLDPYSSQNGPDLKVYLSKDEGASEYINLGNLKSTMGKQVYPIPGGTDIVQFKYVHIWCEKFTVVFAIAELK